MMTLPRGSWDQLSRRPQGRDHSSIPHCRFGNRAFSSRVPCHPCSCSPTRYELFARRREMSPWSFSESNLYPRVSILEPKAHVRDFGFLVITEQTHFFATT